MKRADIVVDGEYAVVTEWSVREGTQAGTAGLKKATVLGFEEVMSRRHRGTSTEVRVRLAEPLSNGQTEFTIPPRKVIAPWDAHEAARVKREEDERIANEQRAVENDRLMAARRELLALLPEKLRPYWLNTQNVWSTVRSGTVTVYELLDIVQHARGSDDVNALAAIIREVDGNHALGAAVLAERLVERGVRTS